MSAQKHEKLTLPFPFARKMFTWLNPPCRSDSRTYHEFRKPNFFLHQKVRTSASEEPPHPCHSATLFFRESRKKLVILQLFFSAYLLTL